MKTVMKVILLVEDEPDILETLVMVLKMEGYNVLTASNGKMGLERLEDTMPDLIISDIMMPVLTGLEMLRVIRSTPEYSQIPVLLMSAGRLTAKKVDCQWTEFLSKPLSLDHFLAVVTRIIRKAPETDLMNPLEKGSDNELEVVKRSGASARR